MDRFIASSMSLRKCFDTGADEEEPGALLLQLNSSEPA